MFDILKSILHKIDIVKRKKEKKSFFFMFMLKKCRENGISGIIFRVPLFIHSVTFRVWAKSNL